MSLRQCLMAESCRRMQSLHRFTLSVNSDLEAIGLTAASSAALGKAGISCNVVAGVNHDHIFVPIEQAGLAMQVLRALQK